MVEPGPFGCFQQADRAPGEDAPVAPEVGRPGRVGDLGIHRPGDIDRIRIERFGDQRDPAGEIVVDLLFGALARMGNPAFKVRGQFADLGQLVAQLDRGFAPDAGGMAGRQFELAGGFRRTGAHRRFHGGEHIISTQIDFMGLLEHPRFRF